MTYTVSAAQAGRGSTIGVGATPTLIGEVKNAPFNRGKWQFVDVTNFQSGADKEILSTIRDNGSVEITGNRVAADAGQVAVEALYLSGAISSYTLQLPKTPTQTVSGDKYVFNAYVESSDFTVDVEKEISMKIALKVSGAAVYTAGA